MSCCSISCCANFTAGREVAREVSKAGGGTDASMFPYTDTIRPAAASAAVKDGGFGTACGEEEGDIEYAAIGRRAEKPGGILSERSAPDFAGSPPNSGRQSNSLPKSATAQPPQSNLDLICVADQIRPRSLANRIWSELAQSIRAHFL